jgi:hypothetical protein
MMLGILISWVLGALGISTLAVFLSRKFGIWILYAVFAMLVLISNLAAGKLISIGPAVVPSVVAIYAVTFLCTDAVCELYGKEEAKRVVLGGFLANIMALPLIYLVVAWPAVPFQMEFAEKFDAVFGFVPRIIIASMIAYLCSQTHDVYIYAWYKEKMKGRFMWFRNNASTILSQLIDSSLFITLAFYGVLPTPVVLSMIAFQWLIKVGIALTDTPFLYLIVKASRWITPKGIIV